MIDGPQQYTNGPFSVYDEDAHAAWCASLTPPLCPATFVQSNGAVHDVIRRPCGGLAGHYPAEPHHYSMQWIEPGDTWPSATSSAGAAPRIDELTQPDGVTATFTSSCAWGCTVRTVDGQEQPHTCVGGQVIAVLAPSLSFAEVQHVAHGLKPLIRELKGDSWVDGVRSGRRGPCYGVPEDDETPGSGS